MRWLGFHSLAVHMHYYMWGQHEVVGIPLTDCTCITTCGGNTRWLGFHSLTVHMHYYMWGQHKVIGIPLTDCAHALLHVGATRGGWDSTH